MIQPHIPCRLALPCPAELSIHQNAYTLARYAVICQANGLVSARLPAAAAAGHLSRGAGCRRRGWQAWCLGGCQLASN
jgi:fructose-bisphosphate aldolase class 1